jgi:hypothetical protein
MDDADLLCNRATPIFALAARAKKAIPSTQLNSLAREVVRHAVAIERRFR